MVEVPPPLFFVNIDLKVGEERGEKWKLPGL